MIEPKDFSEAIKRACNSTAVGHDGISMKTLKLHLSVVIELHQTQTTCKAENRCYATVKIPNK